MSTGRGRDEWAEMSMKKSWGWQWGDGKLGLLRDGWCRYYLGNKGLRVPGEAGEAGRNQMIKYFGLN